LPASFVCEYENSEKPMLRGFQHQNSEVLTVLLDVGACSCLWHKEHGSFFVELDVEIWIFLEASSTK
jgi:hypothetical protein